MSEIAGVQRRRRRRADAERSYATILDTAVRVLNERPDASVGEIAKAAGLTRPTVYAHYPSREALLAAVIDRITSEAVAAIDAADLDHGPAVAALRRYLDAGWETLARYPVLLGTRVMRLEDPNDRHQPIQQRLERLVARGQDAGEFDRTSSATWLAAIIIGLGHIAGEQVAAGSATADTARAALEHTVLRAVRA